MLPERLTGAISPDGDALAVILTRAVELGRGTLPAPRCDSPRPLPGKSAGVVPFLDGENEGQDPQRRPQVEVARGAPGFCCLSVLPLRASPTSPPAPHRARTVETAPPQCEEPGTGPGSREVSQQMSVDGRPRLNVLKPGRRGRGGHCPPQRL